MKKTESIGSSQWLQTFLPSSLLILVAVNTAWPLTNVRLDRHDHPVHLLKAWQFFNEMLLHGRLSGYNNHYAFGYPVNDITSCGGEMWVALFRIVTLGRLNWEQTYKLALGGLVVFVGLSTFAFARRYFGVVTGTLAGLFAILDPGGLYQGGWVWLLDFGVWPVSLSCCCVMMALAKLEDTASRSRRWDLVSAGLWIAASLWAHPLSLMLLAIALPLLLTDIWARDTQPVTLPWFRIAVSYALGFGLAAFTLVPMLARAQYTYDRGGLGESVQTIAEKLVELRSFDGMWVFIAAVGVVGAIRALKLQRRGTLLLVSAFALCLLMATELFVRRLHIERIYPAYVKLEAGRMLMGCKLFGFPLAAYGAVSLFASGRAIGITRGRWAFRLVLAFAALLPFASPGWHVIHDRYVEKKPNTEFPTSVIQDNDRLNRWALDQRTRSSDFYRIAYSISANDLLECQSPIYTKTPIYLNIGTSAMQFNVFPDDMDPEILEALSVRFLVTDSDRTDPNFALEQTFGRLKVYRFARYHKERFSFVGEGHGELLEFSPDSVRIRVTDAQPGTKLKLHLAAYDRWEAVQNGQILPIRVATITAHEYPVLMEVPIGPGEVQFRYVRRGVDWFGLGLTLLTLGVVVRYGWLQRRYPVRLNISVFVERHKRGLGWSILALVGVVSLVAVARAASKQHLLPKDSLFHRLEGRDITLAGHACTKLGPLDFSCADKPLSAEYMQGSWGSHLCMSTEHRQAMTIVADTTLGSRIQVYTDTFADDGSIHLIVNGKDLGTEATRGAHTDWRVFQFDTNAFAGRDVNVRLVLTGAALRCFDIRIIS